MSFLNKYPYTDFHELNLDWVLAQIAILRNDVAAEDARLNDFAVDLTNFQTALNSLRAAAILVYGALEETDLNNVKTNGCWILTTDYNYTNKPPYHGNTGFLRVVRCGQYVLQTLIDFDGAGEYKRRINYDDSYQEEWQYTGGNSFLQAKTDGSDRSDEILLKLNLWGHVELGAGDYVVTNLIMPADTSILGCGYKTNIIKSNDGTYAIRLGNQCHIENLRITGKASGSVTPSATLRNNHGLEWHGTNAGPYFGMISNVWIRNVEGVGLYVTDTGNPTYNNMLAEKVYIENCDAGVLTSNSEYHSFTDFKVFNCYYGCINRGGNNFFTSCDFTSCKVGFMIDNYAGNYPNVGHGGMANCVFNHINSNNGDAIYMEGNDYGFVISGCTFFYSHIHLKNCKAITFTGCNFGGGSTTVDISHDSVMPNGATLFTGCCFSQVPSGTQDSDTHSENCYTFAGSPINF